jgi:hypothetical protein
VRELPVSLLALDLGGDEFRITQRHPEQPVPASGAPQALAQLGEQHAHVP